MSLAPVSMILQNAMTATNDGKVGHEKEIPISTLVPSQQSSLRENLFLVPLTLIFLERMRIAIDFFAPVKESCIA